MDELWMKLRKWQGHPSQGWWRPVLWDLRNEWAPSMGWEGLCDLAQQRDFPLREMERESPVVEKELQRELEEMRRREISRLTFLHAVYPAMFAQCMDPPLTLSFLGDDAQILSKPALSVVGSREPREETLVWMEKELGAFCRHSRPLIVSGGARGVDQKAHSVALRNGCATVAVLPSGLLRIYPRDFQDWQEQVVASGGGFLSEYPLTQEMHRDHFHHRNRLIAALGVATLVTEAKQRSGTLITALRAAEIGRPLWAVPAHPLSPFFRGGLQILAEGGAMVRDQEDLTIFWQSEMGGLLFSGLDLDKQGQLDNYP